MVEVHSIGRRTSAIQLPKLTSHIVDFAALPSLSPADELYLALGTTIKVAGNQSTFPAIGYDANLAVVTAALNAGVRKVGLVSTMGAHANSMVFYSLVKGDLEMMLAKCRLALH